MSTAAPSAALDVEQVRRDFPILSAPLPGDRTLVYLDNAASTQRPRAVTQALVELDERHYANVHRGIHALSEQATELYEAAREKTRALLGARETAEIVFTRGTTESINLVARSWGDANLRPGDQILLTLAEHHANIVPWQQAAARTGATVRFARLSGDGRLDQAHFAELLGSGRVRMAAFTAVSNVLGTVLPVAELVSMAHVAGALALVDAAQLVGHAPCDVAALGADFLAFSGHKMLAPPGIGVLYGRRALLEAMPPFLGGGGMIRRVRTDGFEPAELPDKFEAGTPPIASAIGLAAAIDYLAALGLARVQRHVAQLTRLAHERLSLAAGVRVIGPAPEHRAGIVSFAVEGVHPHDVAQLLDRRGIAIRAGHHCAMPLHESLGLAASSRASFYCYNTADEVEALTDALEWARRFLRRG